MNKYLTILLAIIAIVYTITFNKFINGDIEFFKDSHSEPNINNEVIQSTKPFSPSDDETDIINPGYGPGGYVPSEDNTQSPIASKQFIDLSKHDSDLVISESGKYTLTGNFSHSVIVEADGEVTLTLENVNIAPEGIIGPIANNTSYDLFINLAMNSENTLKESAQSRSEGCISSLGKIVIDGIGSLNIFGNNHGIYTEEQNVTIYNGYINIESKQDGIGTGRHYGGIISIYDGHVSIKSTRGYLSTVNSLIIRGGDIYIENSFIEGKNDIVIYNGNVTMLGSKNAQIPNALKQELIVFKLDETQKAKSLNTVLFADEIPVNSFIPDGDFDTLIMTSPDFEAGLYTFYTGGSNTGIKEGNVYVINNYKKGEKIDNVTIDSPIK